MTVIGMFVVIVIIMAVLIWLVAKAWQLLKWFVRGFFHVLGLIITFPFRLIFRR